MRPNTPEVVRRANARALIAALLCAALVVACLCLPLYSFSATVFAKKSGNTFVGDEKYKEVRAEVEAEARARADAAGTLPEIVENVTERTNSKGEKTSMVAFEVRQVMRRSGWQFIAWRSSCWARGWPGPLRRTGRSSPAASAGRGRSRRPWG